MKLFNITKIVIIATSFITIIKSTELEITRIRPKGRNGWTQGRDFFKIQPSLSTQYGGNNTTVNCAKFNADEITHGGDQFTCLCSNENGTLILENDEWRCRQNSHVRKLLGEFITKRFFRLFQ